MVMLNPLIRLLSRFEFVDETESTTADETVNTVQTSNENVNITDRKSTRNNSRTV